MRFLIACLLLLLAAVAAGSARADELDWLKQRRDYKTLFPLALKQAEQGNAEAIRVVGLMYLEGLGTPVDPAAAAQFLRRATNAGDPMAPYWLGSMYAHGRGIPKDEAAAWPLMRLSSDRGYALAQFGLGDAALRGLLAQADPVEAWRLWSASARQGYEKAFHGLGALYHSGLNLRSDDKRFDDLLKGVSEDGSAGKSLEELQSTWAALRRGPAMEVTITDEPRALYWYRRAAKAGVKKAQVNLGDLLRIGKVEQDHAEAFFWFQRAAGPNPQADEEAQTVGLLNLAMMHENGWGTPKNLERARQLYEAAEKRGPEILTGSRSRSVGQPCERMCRNGITFEPDGRVKFNYSEITK